MDFSRTRLSWRRPITDYTRVQHAVSAVVRNRAALQRWTPKPLLNVGCGPFPHPNFVNLDWHWRPGVVCWDATRTLPFERMEGAFTEHCIEHLPFAAVPGLLRELRRVLVPGATLRIVVPDGEMYARNYAAGAPMPLGAGEMSPMFSINRIFREHGHQFIYDFETLALLLRAAGFAEVRKCAFREGRDARLLIDLPERAVESLYVEAH